MKLIDGGADVEGQVTLDNCGYDFTTEANRVARRQYGMLDATSRQTGLTNELVAYDSAAHAAKAVSQWHSSAVTCPHTAVNSSVAGVPDLLVKVMADRVNVVQLPAIPNVITTESATAAGQGTLYNVSIIQAHGRYLDAVYLTSETPLTTKDVQDATTLAIATGTRLAAAR